MFGTRIEGGRGFVEDQHGRVAHDGAGNGQSLTLPGRQLAAAFAKFRVVAVRHLPDQLVGAGDLGGFLDGFPLDVGGADRDVVRDGVGEQDVFLQRDHGMGADVVGRHVAQIDAVDGDLSGHRIVKP